MHVPYKDSKLTHLLKDYLDGDARVAIIATCGPADVDETVSTLKLVEVAKQVSCTPKANDYVEEEVSPERLEEISKSRWLPAEECAKREKERLDRLAEERRKDLEEHLRRWAEQYQRTCEGSQSTSSPNFTKDFRNRSFAEGDPPRQDSNYSFSGERPHKNGSTGAENNGSAGADKNRSDGADKNGCAGADAGGGARGSASASRPRVRRAMTVGNAATPQRTDPLKAAMDEVAARLRESVDLPRDKRKIVLAGLRLRWHPDKNPENVEVATKVFQFMQELKERLWT